jgi:hypothetical protein
MINIAVIGAGAISGFHIEGYLAFPGRCRIVSVVDIDRAKAERQIERYHLDAGAVAVAADDIGDGDPFCTRDGLLAAAPRFHEKTVSVPGFADNQITVTGAQR